MSPAEMYPATRDTLSSRDSGMSSWFGEPGSFVESVRIMGTLYRKTGIHVRSVCKLVSGRNVIWAANIDNGNGFIPSS